MKNPPVILFRRAEPSALDHADQGTLCIVAEAKLISVYCQIGSSEDNPVWELIATYEQ